MSAGLDRTAVPTSIHCDHLIQASTGADADLKVHIKPGRIAEMNATICTFVLRAEFNRLQPGSLRLFRECSQKVRDRILGTGLWNHPSNCPRELCRPWDAHVRSLPLSSTSSLHRCLSSRLGTGD